MLHAIISQKHVALEHGGPTYTCTQCEYTCYTKAVFEKHEQSHMTTMEFQCSQCGIYLRSAKQLQQHENKHEGILPFKCTQCPQVRTRSFP